MQRVGQAAISIPRDVRSLQNDASFKGTRHGAAHPVLDRMSLFIHGPLKDAYVSGCKDVSCIQ